MKPVILLCCLAKLCSLPTDAFSPAPQPHATVTSLAFSPDSKQLASAGWDATIRIWDTSTGKSLKVIRAGNGPARSVQFHPTKALLASGSWDGPELRDTHTWNKTKAFRTDLRVADVTLSPGDSVAAAAYDIYVWNANTGKLMRSMEASGLCIKYSHDGKLIVSGDWDGYLTVWDSETGKMIRTVKVNEMDLRNVDISPDGTLAACGGWSDTVTLIKTETGEVVKTLRLADIGSLPLCFSPDGKLLAAGSDSGWIKVWDIATGNVVWASRGHTQGVSSLACSPNGKLVASGSEDGTIILWNAATGKAIRRLKGHTSRLWK